MALPAAAALHRFLLGGFRFDDLYDFALVRPVLWLTRVNRDDVVDFLYGLVERGSRLGHALVSRSEDGRLRRYAGWIAIGSLGALAIAMFVA
jgi:NADH-quinone oxidoreductase subunit L